MDEMDTDGPKRHKAYSFDAKTVLSWDGNGCKESSKNELLMGVKKTKQNIALEITTIIKNCQLKSSTK